MMGARSNRVVIHVSEGHWAQEGGKDTLFVGGKSVLAGPVWKPGGGEKRHCVSRWFRYDIYLQPETDRSEEKGFTFSGSIKVTNQRGGSIYIEIAMVLKKGGEKGAYSVQISRLLATGKALAA